jgi:hypothetical protein
MLTVNGAARPIDASGAYPLIDHGHHEHGVLELAAGEGLVCHAVCFTPGTA